MTRPTTVSVTVEIPRTAWDEAEVQAKVAGLSVPEYLSRLVTRLADEGRGRAYWRERASRADPVAARTILQRAGTLPPRPDDKLPEDHSRA